MELRQLEIFEAIARTGSFTRAAEALYITQPAVTRQIAGLEAELRTPLFDRLGRAVQMTDAGETLHRYAEAIVRLANEAKAAVGDIGAGVAGRLAVGASSTLATYVLPPFLRDFRALYPRVEIAVHTGISAQVVEMTRSNEVDLGLVTDDAPDKMLVAIPLSNYETCVVVPPGHPLASRETVSAAELAGSPLILMEVGTNLRTYVDRLLNAAGVEEQVTMELDNVEAIKRMIEADLGLSILPQMAVAAEVEAGRLVALKLTDVPRAHRRIALIYRHDKYLSVALRAFMELLQTRLATPTSLPAHFLPARFFLIGGRGGNLRSQREKYDNLQSVGKRRKRMLENARLFRWDDLDDVVKLIAACEVEDKNGSVPTAERLRHSLAFPGMEADKLLYVLPDGKGALAATFAGIPMPGKEGYTIETNVMVRPDYRNGDLADLILRQVEQNAAAWHLETGQSATLQAGALSYQIFQNELYTRNGYQTVRWFLELERDLTQPIIPLPVPPGINIRSFVLPDDIPVVHFTFADAFQDHWNPPDFTLDQITHFANGPDSRIDLSLLAESETGEMAGVCWNDIRAEYNRQNGTQEGFIGILGVRRPFRRQGLARALLTATLLRLRDEGMTVAILDVDAESPTGATRLYEAVGFRERKRTAVYQKPVA